MSCESCLYGYPCEDGCLCDCHERRKAESVPEPPDEPWEYVDDGESPILARTVYDAMRRSQS